jgi:predicted ABC-type ATPase
VPSLFIIAGPNGAGKSTFSKKLIAPFDATLTPFDFDKEFDLTWRRFSYDPRVEEGAWETVTNLFETKKEEVIRAKSNFAFETNFHNDSVLKTVNEFTQAGYETQLDFLTLESVEKAIERVKDRVAKNGHSVDEETIAERFYAGLKYLDESFHLFNRVAIFESPDFDFGLIVSIEPTKKLVRVSKSIDRHLLHHLPTLDRFILRYR